MQPRRVIAGEVGHDLDAAMGKGSNDQLVEFIASRSAARVGGGVRSPERARTLVAQGAHRVIVGTAAFDRDRLREISEAVSKLDEVCERAETEAQGAAA